MLLQEAGLATLKVVSKPGRITLPGHVAQIVRNLSGQEASNLVGRIRMLSEGDEEVRHRPARVNLHVLSGFASHQGLPCIYPPCASKLTARLYIRKHRPVSAMPMPLAAGCCPWCLSDLLPRRRLHLGTEAWP